MKILDAHHETHGHGAACLLCDYWVKSTWPRASLYIEEDGWARSTRIACESCAASDDEVIEALAATSRGESSDARVVNLDAALAAAIHNGRAT